MIHIVCILPDTPDATVFYRSTLPLAELRHDNVTFSDEKVINWATFSKADIVFIQRPADSNRLEAAKLAKLMNKPLWLDYDDDLINIPKHNGYYAHCEKHKDDIQQMLDLADVITVSTEQLKESLGRKDKTVVIPNAYNDSLFEYAKELDTDRNNYVVWRGSATHKLDLKEVYSQIVEFNKQVEDFALCFMGYDPEFLTLNLREKSFRVIKPMGLLPFFKKYNELAPFMTFVPLVDDLFNRAKSNIAWIESTHAGAVTLARRLPEFDKPGVVTYDTPAEMLDKMLKLVRGEMDAYSYVAKSREYIKNNLLLSKVNRQRIKVINKLLTK